LGATQKQENVTKKKNKTKQKTKGKVIEAAFITGETTMWSSPLLPSTC
jgi:hypothetical protein